LADREVNQHRTALLRSKPVQDQPAQTESTAPQKKRGRTRPAPIVAEKTIRNMSIADAAAIINGGRVQHQSAAGANRQIHWSTG